MKRRHHVWSALYCVFVIASACVSGCKPRAETERINKDDSIDQLANTIKNDPLRRVDAICRVREIGPEGAPAIPSLIEVCNDRDEQVRCLAIVTLGEINQRPDDVVPVFEAALKDENWEVRFEAIKGLEEFGGDCKPATDALERALLICGSDVQTNAEAALSRILPNCRFGILALVNQLQSDNEKTRGAAALALGRHTSPKGTPRPCPGVRRGKVPEYPLDRPEAPHAAPSRAW